MTSVNTKFRFRVVFALFPVLSRTCDSIGVENVKPLIGDNSP